MIADAGLDARLARAPLNHPVAILLRHSVRNTCRTPRCAEQRTVLVLRDARSGDVFVEVSLQLGYARCFMLLAAFLVEADPTGRPWLK